MERPDAATEVASSLIGRLERLAEAVQPGQHRRLFAEWLALPLRGKLNDLERYVGETSCDPRLIACIEAFRRLIPASTEDFERRLYECAVEAALPFLRNAVDGQRSWGGWRVRRALDLAVNGHGDTRLTLAETARRLDISADHLSRLFAKCAGLPFRQYTLRLRILRAAELLRDPGQRPKVIADELGYADVSNFAREFHRVLGLSPGDYREQV